MNLKVTTAGCCKVVVAQVKLHVLLPVKIRDDMMILHVIQS